MSNTVKKSQEVSLQALYKGLEVRYGAGLAQGIVDQIKKMEDRNHKLGFMDVKALSEVLEVLRAEARSTVKKLRNAKSAKIPVGVVNLDTKRFQNDLNRHFACYWLVQHNFYKAYARAMKICEVPEYGYDTYTKPTEIKMVA